MSTNHHTPITNGAPRNAAIVNAPLSQLDTKISSLDTDLATRSKVWDGNSIAPTINDDLSDGISVGDMWIDETNDKAYICLNNSVGAAIWSEITLRETEYDLSITVISNNLTLAITHADGSTPSTTRPLWVKIGNTWREITTATSCTLASGTSWFNAGSSELATYEIDYFAYAIWDSDSSIVSVSPSRIPYGRLVSDFSGVVTNDKHLANYANFTSSDDVCQLGRFAASLSAGAAYTWSVPTYDNSNKILHSIMETRRLTYAPVPAGFSGTPTVGAANYQVVGKRCRIEVDNISGISDDTIFTLTAPFQNNSATTCQGVSGYMTDNGVALTAAGRIGFSVDTNVIDLNTDMASGTWTNSGTKSAYFHIDHYLVGE